MLCHHLFRPPDLIFAPPRITGSFIIHQHPSHAPLAPGEFIPLDALQSAFAIEGDRNLARPGRWFVLESLHCVLTLGPGESVRITRVFAVFNSRRGEPYWLAQPRAPGLGGACPSWKACGPQAMPGQAWSGAGGWAWTDCPGPQGNDGRALGGG